MAKRLEWEWAEGEPLLRKHGGDLALRRAVNARVGPVRFPAVEVRLRLLQRFGNQTLAPTRRESVLDVFESTAGLDSSRADTDGDGITDYEEDTDGDDVANGIAWPYGCDPRRVAAHYGALDPLRLGFRQERQFDGAAAADIGMGPAWQVDSPMGFYYWKLTQSQKRAAMTRGWRLRAQLALHEGLGFVNLDLVPHAGRFDLTFLVRPEGQTSFLLVDWSMPRQGQFLDQGRGATMPLVEYLFDPASRTASLLVNGRTVRRDYAGYQQYQEDFGLFFGTNNDMGAAAKGLADFALAELVIR